MTKPEARDRLRELADVVRRLKHHSTRLGWKTARVQTADLSALLSAYDAQAERLRVVEGENAALRSDVCAFCAPWAVTYARDFGLPTGHLHPVHYDILERAGARMVAFTRAALTQSPPAMEKTDV